MHLIGLCRLGRDAVLRHTQGGDPVLSLALAFNYGAKDNEGRRPTQWVEAAVFGKRAESLQQYMLKGQQVMVHISDVHIEEFERRDGSMGTTLRGRVSEIQFAGGGQQSGSSDQQQSSPSPSAGANPQRQSAPPQQRARPPAPAPAARSPAGGNAYASPGGDFDDFNEDDVPF